MLPFISRIVRVVPADQLLSHLNLTAFTELMDIDLYRGVFMSRYHADGKFFTPALTDSFEQLVEYTSAHMVHPEDREAHLRLMDCATMEERFARAEIPGIISGEIRYLGIDGNWYRMFHLLISGEKYGLRPHQVYFYLYDILDVQYRENGQHRYSAESREMIRRLLPDLLSESRFFSLSDERLKRFDRPWCMIAVDIKHYKLFKELNGQEKGDQLLIHFGETLQRTAQEMDGLACYRGQDDYGLLIPFEKPKIDQLFSELRREIEKLSRISGFYPIFGICLADEECFDAIELFNRAALTAEEIRDDLRYHIRVYDAKLHERHVEEFKLLAEFNEAMANNTILFYLQPQVNVQSRKIVGAESLARWQKEDGSFMSPDQFVPVLEKYGVVTDLDIRIWEQVCQWLRSLLDRGIKPVPVSVNVSRVNIFTVDVPELLSRLMIKYQLPAELLEVEITESAYVDDSERVSSTIAELRKRGFRVLMDDFGSGYSSLNMLRNISVDVIKLDAQFLRFSAGEVQKGVNILESVISMTKSLSTPIIVEGVETEEMIRFLRDLGCGYMQGYYYYRPMPPARFEALLANPEEFDYRGIFLQRNQQMHPREFLDENLYSDAMLNNILGPVAFYSRQGENVDIIRFNQQFVDLVGLESDVLEERRHHIQQFFHPDDLGKYHAMLDAAAQDRINGASGRFRIYKPNGTLLWMQLHVYLLRDEDGLQTFYGSARDMTEVQYINQEMPGGYYRSTLGDGYEFLYLSQIMLEMFGYTREEIRTRFDNRMIRLIHPEDRETVLRESGELQCGTRKNLSPYRILHKDGTYRYVLDQSRITDQFGELCWQSVVTDITEVMTLRNRMRLLEKYSTDCVLFIPDMRNPEQTEIVCYGLEPFLKLNEEEFRQQLSRREIRIRDRNGAELYDLWMMTPGEDCSRLNGAYTMTVKDGTSARCHVRINRITDRKQGVDCIMSILPVSGE